jgi:peptidoglycan LD-endopeptidase CwlK
MAYKLGKNTTKHLHTLKSQMMILAVEGFINHTPIDFCILDSGGFRTAEEQNAFFKKGLSKCDGYNIKSKHQSGKAVDLVPFVDGKPTWDEKSCFYLAGAFRAYCNFNRIPITSGADWNNDGVLKDGWDPCHFEENRPGH